MALQSCGSRWPANGSGRIPERDQNLFTPRNILHGPDEGQALVLMIPLRPADCTGR